MTMHDVWPVAVKALPVAIKGLPVAVKAPFVSL